MEYDVYYERALDVNPTSLLDVGCGHNKFVQEIKELRF